MNRYYFDNESKAITIYYFTFNELNFDSTGIGVLVKKRVQTGRQNMENLRQAYTDGYTAKAWGVHGDWSLEHHAN